MSFRHGALTQAQREVNGAVTRATQAEATVPQLQRQLDALQQQLDSSAQEVKEVTTALGQSVAARQSLVAELGQLLANRPCPI